MVGSRGFDPLTFCTPTQSDGSTATDWAGAYGILLDFRDTPEARPTHGQPPVGAFVGKPVRHPPNGLPFAAHYTTD